MAKPTLIEMVQEISKAIGSDDVNSITDTPESMDIATLIHATYLNMLTVRNWSHQGRTIQFSASGTTSRPTHMSMPDNLKELVTTSVNYNKIKSGETRLNYLPVKWQDSDTFLRNLNSRNSDDANVLTITDPSGVQFLIRDDKAPEFFTSFDDVTLVFDSYDSDVDSTLQESKTQARAYIMLDFDLLDASVPDLPSDAFRALVEEAKSRASIEIKLTENIKAEQQSRKQNKRLSDTQWRAAGGVTFPNRGRPAR